MPTHQLPAGLIVSNRSSSSLKESIAHRAIDTNALKDRIDPESAEVQLRAMAPSHPHLLPPLASAAKADRS